MPKQFVVEHRCGLVADECSGSALDPLWFALDESRGLEDPLLKVYMRATVIISEYLIYIPAIIVFLRRYSRLNGVPTWSGSVALVAILLQPSTILIDHGHFQYNTVMLGLVVATLESILAGRLLSACVFFVAALGFKQMALYYAPIVFAFLLGKCFVPRFRILLLLSIAITTIAAFAMLFAPLLVGSFYDWYHGLPLSVPLPPLVQSLPVTLEGNSWYYAPIVQVSQVIHRIFPFSRGIFEDKVANAWCAIHTFVKLHRFPTTVLQRASLGFTLLSILVPCAAIFRNPRPALLPLALASAAWGFFLFSFQVHEKSVLLPLLPMTLLLGGDSGLSKETRAWVGWANMIAVWTIYPLFKREDLCVPYFVVTLLWAYLLGLPPVSLEVYRARSLSKNSAPSSELHFITKFLHLLFYLSMVVWHVLEAAVPPPADKPDLWVVLNVLIGASGLCIIYLWCTWRLVVQIYGTAYRWPEEESKLKPS